MSDREKMSPHFALRAAAMMFTPGYNPYRDMAERLGIGDEVFFKHLTLDLQLEAINRRNVEMAKVKQAEFEVVEPAVKVSKKKPAKKKAAKTARAKSQVFNLKGSFKVDAEGAVTKHSKSVLKVVRGRKDKANEYTITMVIAKK